MHQVEGIHIGLGDGKLFFIICLLDFGILRQGLTTKPRLDLNPLSSLCGHLSVRIAN